LIAESGADVVLNCVGLLQDQPGKSTHEAHDGFVERLIAGLRALPRPVLLINRSIFRSRASRAATSRRSRKASGGPTA
jgi:hypothetical protein